MKNPDPLEKDIEKRVCDHAKSLGILAYKFVSPSRRSVPDRMYVLPGGRMFMIEFKRKGKEPSAAQAVEIAKLRNQGVTVYVVDNVKDGKYLIDSEFHVGPFPKKDPLEWY